MSPTLLRLLPLLLLHAISPCGSVTTTTAGDHGNRSSPRRYSKDDLLSSSPSKQSSFHRVRSRRLQQESLAAATSGEANCSDISAEVEISSLTSFVQVSGVPTSLIDRLGTVSNTTGIPVDEINGDGLVHMFVEAYNSFHKSSKSSCLEHQRRGTKVSISSGLILHTQEEDRNGTTSTSAAWMELRATCLGCEGEASLALFAVPAGKHANESSVPPNGSRQRQLSRRAQNFPVQWLQRNDASNSTAPTNSSTTTSQSAMTMAPAASCLCDPPLATDFTSALQNQLQESVAMSDEEVPALMSLLQVVEMEPVAPGCESLPIGHQEAHLALYLQTEKANQVPDLAPLETAVVEVYNRINQYQQGLCDPLGRTIESVHASVVDPSVIYPLSQGEGEEEEENTISNNGLIIVVFDMVLSCIGCGEMTTSTTISVFDTLTVRAGTRHLQQQLQDTHARCLCPLHTDGLEYRGPTLDEFEQELSALLPEMGLDSSRLLDVVEYTALPCDQSGDDNRTKNLTQVLLVDFVVNCSLVDADAAYLADEFVSVYNTLNKHSYCDPYLRQMTSATVLRRGEPSLQDGTLTLELLVTGTCLGCDSVVDGFYHIPAAISFDATTVSINEALNTEVSDIDLVNNTDTNSTNSSLPINSTGVVDNGARRRLYTTTTFSRYLQQEQQDGRCYCPLDAVGTRAPTEAEVMDEFRGFVQEASGEEGLFRCVSSVGQCQFGTTFESSLLVALVDSNSTLDFASDLEVTLQNTLNGLFAPRVGICRPEFRLVQSVSASFGLLEQELGQQQRHLVYSGSSQRRKQQEEVASSNEPVHQPSSGPLMDANSSSTNVPTTFTAQFPPTASPTIRTVDTVLVLLSVSGVCNGCSSELLFQDQVIGGVSRRRIQEDDDNDDVFFPFAPITTTKEPESNCFCPIASVVQEGNPSADIVLDEYNSQLEDLDVPLNVHGLEEVQVVDCNDEIETFDTTLKLEVLLRPDISDRELSELLDIVQDTFHELTQQRYCDPWIRRMDTLDVKSMQLIALGEDGCHLYSLTLDVSGTCRGCQDDSPLFDANDNDDDDERRRRLDADFDNQNPFWSHPGKQPRRRRLQGSDVCLCERRTIADRAPSPEEFENELGSEIDKGRFDSVCGLANRFQEAQVTQEPSSLPSLQPSTFPTACTATLTNEFQSELVLYVENGDHLDVETRTLLGDAVETAYNELVQAQYALCDPLYREVTSINLVEAERRERRLRGKERENADFVVPTRALQSNNQNGVMLRYAITGRCEECGATSNFLDVLSGGEVVALVRELVGLFMDASLLLDISEIDNVDCSGDTVDFDEVVIVELVATCLEEENFGFDNAVILAIEEAFVSTYNLLASQYCDKYFTTLIDARLENVGTITVEGNIPIEIRVFAQCLGCNPEQVGIYGSPSAIESDRGRRNLESLHSIEQLKYYSRERRQTLEDDGSCICSAQAIAERPPSESEFIEAFRKSVEELPLECVSSVGECQFGSTFDTDIVLAFEGNQTTLTDEVRQSIQESFLVLLNDLYEPSAEMCNPDFRVIIDVAVVFDFTLNGEFIEAGSNATLEANGRFLEGETVQRRNQDSNVMDSSGNPTPNASLTPSESPTVPNRFPPTASPTISSENDLIRTLLTVSGVCNGCANELFLSNQAIFGGRALGGTGFGTDIIRGLQEGRSETSSNCFCPLTAIVNLVPPSPEEVQSELSRRLEEDEVELVVKNIDTVSAISCDDESETTDFTSEFTFSFSAFPSIPDLEIDQLGNTIATIYNDLVEDYCDPLIRREAALTLVDRSRKTSTGQTSSRRELQTNEDASGFDTAQQIDCVNFEAKFTAKALCRGCNDGTPLLDGRSRSLSHTRSSEVHNRILTSGPRAQKTRRRHLENDPEECFCDSSTIAPRAPTLEELWLRLEAELGSFVNVCGQPVECDPTVFVSQFQETTILALQLVRGTVLTEAHLLELEVAYMGAYNRMQNSLRADKCGGNFRQLSSITAHRGILGGRRDLGEDEEEGGRRLSTQSISLQGTGECPRECNFGRDLDVLNTMLDDIRDLSFVEEVLAVNEYLTGVPSSLPSALPSTSPSASPSSTPSASPSSAPSVSPSMRPSSSPSISPSQSPSVSPSTSPSQSPSKSPSQAPSGSPSNSPSQSPSTSPSTSPSQSPSISSLPSTSPSETPSSSYVPSSQPSANPTLMPSDNPSNTPSSSSSPSDHPSNLPSGSISPSSEPSLRPSGSIVPSALPSIVPSSSIAPSVMPSLTPSGSISPSSMPSMSPTGSVLPSLFPSQVPSLSESPSRAPSSNPSGSGSPSLQPSSSPSTSSLPSMVPSSTPSRSSIPSLLPSKSPSTSSIPSMLPSQNPSLSISPSADPSTSPSVSSAPSQAPSSHPSLSTSPSMAPSTTPSRSPAPSQAPSSHPSLSTSPSMAPSTSPSRSPAPSSAPSSHPSLSTSPSQAPSSGPSLSTSPSLEPSADAYSFAISSTCTPPNNVCNEADGGYFGHPTLVTLLLGLNGDCKINPDCLSQFYDQCRFSPGGQQFYQASCACFPNDDSIPVDTSVCSSFRSCNCVSPTLFDDGTPRIEGSDVCTGADTCNFNTGKIGADGERTCFLSDLSCNCNSDTIDQARCGLRACNFNNGKIVASGSQRACEGSESCNYNSYDTGVLPNVRIEGNACSGSNSCNGNRGVITNPFASTAACGAEACNCNQGTIAGDGVNNVCTGFQSCNNVPHCVTLTSGCNGPGSCSWDPRTQENCCGSTMGCCADAIGGPILFGDCAEV